MITHADLALQVALDRMTFARMRSVAAQTQNIADRITAISDAAGFAGHAGTGVYRAPDLDHLLLEISDSLPIVARQHRTGVLHVMTQAYINGGHTRVVERWVEQEGCSQRHTVVLTAQGDFPVPPRLTSILEAIGGSVVRLNDEETLLGRAKMLRALAAKFDHIVLHTHMHDVIAPLALGTTDGRVIFYNHADHRFSLGMPVASVIAETRTWGQELSIRRRGITGTHVLGIPIRERAGETPSAAARAAHRGTLDLPSAATVAVVAGSPHKFSPMLEYDFFNFARRALAQVPELYLVLIGAPPDSEHFSTIEHIRNRVRLCPATDEAGFQRYILASDFAIDTFPENGCTTLMDMVQAGLPVLSRHAPTGQMDYLTDLPEYCSDDSDLLYQVGRLAESSKYRTERHTEQRERLQTATGPAAFRERLEMLFDAARTASERPAARIGRRDETASELDFLLARSRVQPTQV